MSMKTFIYVGLNLFEIHKNDKIGYLIQLLQNLIIQEATYHNYLAFKANATTEAKMAYIERRKDSCAKKKET